MNDISSRTNTSAAALDQNEGESLIYTIDRECKDDEMFVSNCTSTVAPTETKLIQQNQQHKEYTNVNGTNGTEHDPTQLPIMILSNKCESLFVSSAGDVLTSRCRYSPYPSSIDRTTSNRNNKLRPYQWTDDIAGMCCDMNVTTCSPWGTTNGLANGTGTSNGMVGHSERPHDGLFGGAPLQASISATNTVSEIETHQHHVVRMEVNESATDYDNAIHTSNDDRGVTQQLPAHHSQWNSIIYDKTFSNFDDESVDILPIKSFDYSQYNETSGIDAMSESPYQYDNTDLQVGEGSSYTNHSHGKKTSHHQQKQQQQLFHGIPTFISHFSNVKIQQVSANPMGAHVLLISQPGILYSYGLNTYGQLGIGILSSNREIHQGYIMRPTIVTSLLENGGKAIACAAGVSHSLVVVEVEGKRIIKSQSFEMVLQKQPLPRNVLSSTTSTIFRTRQLSDIDNSSNNSSSESVTVKHQQVYGFGRNDYMKIGLVSPKISTSTNIPANVPSTATAGHNLDNIDCVTLPHRVALRCSVEYNNYTNHRSSNGSHQRQQHQMQGIFAISASAEHSAALVHKQNGDVELYTWGNATYGTLGLPPSSCITPLPMATTTLRIAPHPSLVACISKSSQVDARSPSLLLRDLHEYPIDISLSRCCSFVVTNIGRCFSFGTSEDGMLGLGRNVTETHVPMEVTIPKHAQHEKVISVSAGAAHVTICTDEGNVYSWGARSPAGFDVHTSTSTMQQSKNRKQPTLLKEPTPIEELIQFEWSPRLVDFSTTMVDNFKKSRYSISDSTRRKIVQARAGYDCTFFVTQYGKVLSTGKCSGRIGQGECDTDVTIPKPLYGGLHLFQQNENTDYRNNISNVLNTSYNNDDSYNHHGMIHPVGYSSFRSHARRIASA
jgi:alpha-tubulin suppressor-like RCC1 family protein